MGTSFMEQSRLRWFREKGQETKSICEPAVGQQFFAIEDLVMNRCFSEFQPRPKTLHRSSNSLPFSFIIKHEFMVSDIISADVALITGGAPLMSILDT